MPAALAAVPAIIGVIEGTTTLATAAVTAAASVAVTEGLTLLAKALQKSSTGGIAQEMAVDPTTSRRLLLGRVYTAGSSMGDPITHDNLESAGAGGQLNVAEMLIALGDHECDGLEQVYVNGDLVQIGDFVDGLGYQILKAIDPITGTTVTSNGTNTTDYGGKLWFQFYSGADGQAADPHLLTVLPDSWSADNVGTNLCYVRVTALYAPNVMPDFPSFNFVLRGAKLYDPRADSTVSGGSGSQRWGDASSYVWTENTAVQCYNIVRGISVAGKPFYGNFAPASDIPLDAAFAAMNTCDESVGTLAGPTEARYATGCEIQTAQDARTTLKALCSAMGGRLGNGGQVLLFAGVSQTPVFSFTDSDLIAGAARSFDPVAGVSSLKNIIAATYLDPTQRWTMLSAPPRFSNDDIAADGGFTLIDSYQFDQIQSQTRCQRVTEVLRKRARAQGVATRTFGPAALNARVGEWIEGASLDWSNTDKLFEILGRSVSPTDLNVTLSLREVPDDLDDWDPATDELTGFDVSLPSAAPPPPLTPADYGCAPLSVGAGDGSSAPGFGVSWTDPGTASVVGVIVEYQDTVSGESSYIYGDDPSAEYLQTVGMLLSGSTYNVRLAFQTLEGIDTAFSEWASVTLGLTSYALTLTVPGIGPTLPGSGTEGQLFMDTTDGQLYRYHDGAWTVAVPTVNLVGTITGAQIAAFAIDNTKIASGLSLPATGATLPGSGSEGQLFFDTTDGQLYRYHDGAWTVAVPAVNISGTLTSSQIAAGAIDATKIASGLSLPATGATLPGSGTEGQLFFDTADGQLYRYHSGAWTVAVPAVNISGTLTSSQIAAGAIGATQIASGLSLPATGATLPGSGTEGQLFFDTTDGQLYRYHSGAWTVAVPAGNISGTLTSSQIAAGAIGATQIASSVPVPLIVSTLPTSPTPLTGQIAYLTTDSKLYRWNGSAWIATVATTDLSGTISGSQIASGIIDATKIASGLSLPATGATLPGSGTEGQLFFDTSDGQLYRYHSGAWTVAVPATNISGTLTSSQIAAGAISGTQIASGLQLPLIVSTLPTSPTPTTGQIAYLNSDSKLYRWNGSAWIATVATTDLSGTISGSQIASGIIDATKIASGLSLPATGATLPGSGTEGQLFFDTTDGQLYRYHSSAWTVAVPAGNISGTISGAQIASGAISGTQIASGLQLPLIVSTLPTSPTPTTGQIAYLTTDGKLYRYTSGAWSKAVDGADLIANSIVAGSISAGAIGTTQLAATAVTAAKIASGTITATQIAASTITGSNIAAGTITASNLVANTLTAGTIAAGAIGTTQLAAQAVVASKVYIGDTSNMVPDAAMVDPTGSWTANNGFVSVTATGTTSINKFKIAASSTHDYILSSAIAVEKNTPYYFATTIDNNAGQGAATGLYVNWFQDNACTTPSAITPQSLIGSTATGAVQVESLIVESPTDSVACQFQFDKPAAATAFVYFYNSIMRRATDGDLVVAGSITATMIAAATITGSNIAAGTITASNLFANTLTAGTIAAGAIGTTQLAANAVTAAQLAIGPLGLTVSGLNFQFNNPATNKVSWSAGSIGYIDNTGTAQTTVISSGNANQGGSGTLYIYFNPSGQSSPMTLSTTKVFATAYGSTSGIQNVVLAWYAGGINLDVTYGRALIDGSNINALSITSSQIAAATITGTNIAAGTITASNLVANTLTAGTIAAGAIGTTQLAAKAIVASKMYIGDTSNMIPDAAMTDSSGSWTSNNGFTVNATPSNTSLNSFTIAASSTDSYILSSAIAVEKNVPYYLAVCINNSGDQTANVNFLINWFQDNACTTPSAVTPQSTVGGTSSGSVVLVSSIQTAPSDAIAAQIQFDKPAAATHSVAFASAVMRRATDGNLVVAGSITATAIAAATITGTNIAAGTITASNLVANTLTAGTIAAGAIGTTQLAANAVTAAQLAIGPIGLTVSGLNFQFNNPSTNKVSWSAGSIGYLDNTGTAQSAAIAASNANQGGSGTLYIYFNPAVSTTALQHTTVFATAYGSTSGIQNVVLAWYAGGINLDVTYGRALIDGSNINALSITSSQIAAATITGTNIAAGTITASNLVANTLTAGTIAAGAIGTTQLAANAVTAAQLAIGPIGLTVSGLNFQFNNPSTNKVSWSAGSIGYLDNTGTAQSAAIAASNANQGGSGTLYIYFNPAVSTTALQHTTVFATAYGSTSGIQNVVLAWYAGGINLDVTYGRALIDGSNINALSITSSQIAAATITGTNIAAGTITASNLVANTLTAGTIAAGAIGTTQLAANAVTAAQLAIGPIGLTVSGLNFQFNNPSTNKVSWSAGSIGYLDNTGTAQSAAIAASNANQGGSGTLYIYFNPAVSTTALQHTAVFATAYGSTGGIQNVVLAWYAGGIALDVTYGRALIDGSNINALSITSSQIAAATITGTNIAAGTITASNLVANTLTAGTIAAGAIGTTQLAATAVTAAKIASGTITATQIASGTITSSQIAANTITGSNIAANTITASNITANTLTSGTIAAGAIGTTQLAAGSVTASIIAAGTILAANIAVGTIVANNIAIGSATQRDYVVITSGSPVAITSGGTAIATGYASGGTGANDCYVTASGTAPVIVLITLIVNNSHGAAVSLGVNVQGYVNGLGMYGGFLVYNYSVPANALIGTGTQFSVSIAIPDVPAASADIMDYYITLTAGTSGYLSVAAGAVVADQAIR